LNDYLVEIYFDSSDWDNVITSEQLHLLQSICSRKVEYTQLTQLHLNERTLYIWDDKKKETEEYKTLVDKYFIGGHTNIVPLARFMNLDLKVSYKIKNKIKEVPEYDIQESILHKILSLESKLNQFDSTMQFNTKVGVHISDLGLLNVKQVTWLEDACTEVLQDMLDKGWRILAVCPQPDSRRPDYILGKNDKSENDKEGIYAGRYCS
jgi:hypothetical protein